VPIRFPSPLRPGSRIGVTSPSSGVAAALQPRLDYAIQLVRDLGYEVMVGRCMDGAAHVSAPAADRAAELMSMLTDPSIRVVIPPWGGETAIDLLPLLDFAALAAAEPTWLVGFSDISTLMLPITLRTGIATLHGNNLMDTPYRIPGQLRSWLDIAGLPAGSTFTQSAAGSYRAGGWDDWVTDPQVTELTCTGTGSWVRLDGSAAVDVSGRLIGGCIETVRHLAGTAWGDVAGFGREQAGDGLIVYVESAGDDAFSVCRSLHGMRLAGFFDAAAAVLVGRTAAPDSGSLTQKEAVLDALGCLGVPIIADVECGHVPPYLPIVNGAVGRVQFSREHRSLTQTLR